MSAPTRLRLELGPSVPGWVVRLAPGVLVVLLGAGDGALALLGGTAPPGGLAGSGLVEALLLAAAGVAVWRPWLPTAPFVLVLLGLLVLSGPDLLAAGPLGLTRLAVLLLGTHALLRLTGLAAHTAWSARVEGAVLRRWFAPVVGVQVAVVLLLAAVLLVRDAVGGPGADTGGILRLTAVAAVIAVVLAVVPWDWFRRLRP
ncbi:MAG: hypothetical protein H5T83_10290 [Actinotalea sp.]|nr:hypothetical protein [Actinotalea sp.]